MRIKKNLGIPERQKTVFVMVDIQEAFRPVVKDLETIARNANILIKASQILGIPLVVTEQYPKGLGKTLKEIELPAGIKPIEKNSFSCFGSEEFAKELKKIGAKQMVLFGIEAHVCILNTALEALNKGIEVHIIADAVSSRTQENKEIGIERMRQSNAFIVSTEMVLFQLLRKAGTEEFKKISQLVK